jgi:hypothetical protein
MAEDYTYEITFEGGRDGRDVVELTLTPKPDAAVVWGKVVALVDRDGYLPIETRYYDEDLELARTLTFSDVATLDDRRVPTTLTAVPADKPGESTVIHYKSLEFDVPLDEQFFSLRTLQR